jgi:hypothetical protein
MRGVAIGAAAWGRRFQGAGTKNEYCTLEKIDYLRSARLKMLKQVKFNLISNLYFFNYRNLC